MKHEYKMVNYFNMRALFMGIGISKILISANEYFFVSILLGTIMGALFLHYNKVENKKSVPNIIISSVFMIFGLVILINMISSMYLPEMPKYLVGIPILILLFYILNKNEKVLFRLSSILLVLNISIYILATLSLIGYFEFNNFNYTDTNPFNIIVSAFEYMILSVAPTLLTKSKKYSDISLVKTYIISSITLSVWFFLTYGILGSKLVGLFRYPEYIILKKVALGKAIENIENIVSFMWIFDIIIMILASGNNLKNNLNHKWCMYIIIPIIFIITNLISKDYTFLVVFYKYGTWVIALFFILHILFNKRKKVHQSS